MQTIAIYPGTFDPITLGHLDVVKRATRLFDRVIIAIAEETGKHSLFDFKERITLAKEAAKDLPHVEVIGFKGLLVDFVREQKAHVIIRGLRVGSDFDYEFQMTGINRLLSPETETIFLMPSEHYMYVSSSMVRTIAVSQTKDLSLFVSPNVMAALQAKNTKVAHK